MADLAPKRIDADPAEALTAGSTQTADQHELQHIMLTEIDAARARFTQTSVGGTTAVQNQSVSRSEYARAWSANHFDSPVNQPVFGAYGLDTVNGTTRCGIEGIAKWGFGINPP